MQTYQLFKAYSDQFFFRLIHAITRLMGCYMTDANNINLVRVTEIADGDMRKPGSTTELQHKKCCLVRPGSGDKSHDTQFGRSRHVLY